MSNLVYPLAQIIDIKKRRVEEAEKVVGEKRVALEKEQKILKEKEAERDKAKQHHADKLKQLRKVLDEGTTSTEVLQMKAYIKVAKERVVSEEKKVQDQQKQVDLAVKNLDDAIAELKRKRQEVDKLLQHRTDWTKEMLKELEIIEGREQDELGSTSYLTHHPRKKK